MAFITDKDYSVLVRDEIKEVLEEDHDKKLKTAEKMGISQVRNYLSGRYDTVAIFEANGDDRNHHLVMITLDCILYHLYTSVTSREIPEDRATRYQDALDFLKEAATGDNIMSSLPVITDEDGEELHGIKISSKYQPTNHRW